MSPRHRREPEHPNTPPQLTLTLRPIDFDAVAPQRRPAIPRRDSEVPAISTSDSLILGRR